MIRPLGCVLAATLAFAARAEMRFEFSRQSLIATYSHYRQYIDGREVVGAERIEETRDGVTRVIHERLAKTEPRDRARVAAARCDECVYVNVDGIARLARREVVRERPLEPHAIYIDAESGAILRDDPLFYSISARVFEVNPVAQLNDPSLRDRNDSASAVPSTAYRVAEITSLDPATPLSGANVRIVDTQAPFTAHADPSQSLLFDRSQVQFEEVNAYVHIDRAQRYLQSLGYIGARKLVDYAIPIDPHAANGSDNSFFLQTTPPGHGALFFGDGGTDDAEDSDIMLHEFFHAVHDWIAPGALAGSVTSEARALAEGFADYWSFSSSYAGTASSGRDPFCIADWDARCAGDDPSQQCGYEADADCLRRVDSAKTMANYVTSPQQGTEYENSAIWSSALRQIFMTLVAQRNSEEARRITDTLVIESLFGLPPSPSFRAIAQKMIAADRALRGGAEASIICEAMTLRGILTASECTSVPRGELTYFQSLDQNIPIPDAGAAIESSIVISDTRAIERIGVRVDIDHPVRGDLVITLIAPNGAEFVLKQSLDVDRTPGVHATFENSSLDALKGLPANGVWKLRVRDVFPTDAGSLTSWSLVLQLAGDAAFNERPMMSFRRIVPVVAHIVGIGGVTYTSDVRLTNRVGSRTAGATLIFTPSGLDGRVDFAAIRVSIEPQQTVRIDDVVTHMQMLGSGQLEVASNDEIDVTSSTRGTRVPASPPATGERLILSPIQNDAEFRTNVGFAETRGEVAHVTISLQGASSRTIDVPPFSHVQFAIMDRGTFKAEVTSVGGAVLAYASVIRNATNEATFIRGDPMLLPLR